jgi:hypothetical protein
MGEYRATDGTKSFTPDDTPQRLHLNANISPSVAEIVGLAQNHFGEDVDLDCVSIEAKHIQTSCLGHDVYDPSDYTDFFVLSVS